MKNSSTIIWNDKKAEKLFSDFTVETFMSFAKETPLDLEKRTGIETTIMREHADKNSGEINRRVTKIEIADNIFFLKKAEGVAFEGIRNEFEAINVLPEFNIKPPEVVAYMIDEENRAAFLLLKELSGYCSIRELITGKAPKVAVADFIERKEAILTQLADIMKQVHSAKYTYPDLFAKHVYIKQGSDDIVMIDLDRFRPMDKCPWYFDFPILSSFVKAKCWKKFKRSLRSEILPSKLLNRLLPRWH